MSVPNEEMPFLPSCLQPDAMDAWLDKKLDEKLAQRDAEKIPSLAIIATKGTLDMAYPPFILGSTATALGWDVSIFFTFYGPARISHHPSTATAPWHALAGFRSVGVLDIVPAMPARSSVAKATQAAPLHRLATNGGEKCGLELLKKDLRLGISPLGNPAMPMKMP